MNPADLTDVLYLRPDPGTAATVSRATSTEDGTDAVVVMFTDSHAGNIGLILSPMDAAQLARGIVAALTPNKESE